MSRSLSEGLGIPSSPGTYSAAIEGQTGVYQVLMGRDPSLPPLYGSGVRWEVKEDAPTDTKWRTPQEIVTSGWGDCQELASYRTAELRVTGIDPLAQVRVYPTGENKYHAVVARSNGLVEDPSVRLGMPPFPGEPIMTSQLPAVQGPGGGSPVFTPDAMVGVAKSVCGLHPYTAMTGVGFFGEETGKGPKLARVKDTAPEFQQPTFHITGHKVGSVCGWKGVYRTPMKDGTAIVGMTKTHKHPGDCIGDGAGLISDVASSIAKSPPLLMALSPFSMGTTLALMDPTVQHALGNVGHAVKRAIKGDNSPPPSSGGGGGGGDWPSLDGWSVGRGPKRLSKHHAAIVGWGLSSLTNILSAPLHAAAGLMNTPLSALNQLMHHPSFGNLGHLFAAPLEAGANFALSPLESLSRVLGAGPVSVPRSTVPQGTPSPRPYNAQQIQQLGLTPGQAYPAAQIAQMIQQQQQQQAQQAYQQPYQPYQQSPLPPPPPPSYPQPMYPDSSQFQGMGPTPDMSYLMGDPSNVAAMASFIPGGYSYGPMPS